MKKLLCDICNGTLEMQADGQGAVCTICGITYSVARLKEMLSVQRPAEPASEEIIYDIADSEIEKIYDVTDFEIVGTASDTLQFLLIIEDVFHIAGRGMVVTGYVQGAPVHVGDTVTIVRANGAQLITKVSGIETHKKLLDCANPGDAVGILLANTKPEQVAAGDVLIVSAAPGQTASNYYTLVYCTNCGIPLRITKPMKTHGLTCPGCKTPLQIP